MPSLGGAIGGALGGFASGGGTGALVGGLLGGFGSGDPVSNTSFGSTTGTVGDVSNTVGNINQTGFANTLGNTTGQSLSNTNNFLNTTGTNTSIGTGTSNTAGQTASNQTGQTVTNSGVADFQMPYIEQLLSGALSRFQDPNSQTAGFNPTQIAGQNQLLNTAQNQINPLANQTASTQAFLSNPALLDPNSNPYLAASAQASLNPLINSLTQQILPSITGGAQAVNGVGSSRQGIAEANAINQFQQTAGDMLSNQYNNAYQNGLGTMLQSQSLAPQVAQLLQQPGNIFNQVGALQQGQTQNELNEQTRRLAEFQNLVGSQIYGQTGTTDTTGQGTTSTTGQATTGTTTTGTTDQSQVGGSTTTGQTSGTSSVNQQTGLNQQSQQLVDALRTYDLNTMNQGPQAEANPLAALGLGLAGGQLISQAPENPFAGIFGPGPTSSTQEPNTT